MKEKKRSNSLRNEPNIGLNTRLVRYGHATLSELYVNHKYLCVLMLKSKSKLTFQKPSTIHFSFLVYLTLCDLGYESSPLHVKNVITFERLMVLT